MAPSASITSSPGQWWSLVEAAAWNTHRYFGAVECAQFVEPTAEALQAILEALAAGTVRAHGRPDGRDMQAIDASVWQTYAIETGWQSVSGAAHYFAIVRSLEAYPAAALNDHRYPVGKERFYLVVFDVWVLRDDVMCKWPVAVGGDVDEPASATAESAKRLTPSPNKRRRRPPKVKGNPDATKLRLCLENLMAAKRVRMTVDEIYATFCWPDGTEQRWNIPKAHIQKIRELAIDNAKPDPALGWGSRGPSSTLLQYVKNSDPD